MQSRVIFDFDFSNSLSFLVVKMRLNNDKKYKSLPEQTEHSAIMKKESKEDHDFWQSHHCGILLGIISALFFGALLTCISLAEDLPLSMIIWARFACVFVSASFWGFVGKIKLRMEVEEMKLLGGRFVTGMASLAT